MMIKRITNQILALVVFAASAAANAALVAMPEEALSEVTGQALLVSSRLDGPASGVSSNHDFYRMILDAKVELNMNIDHLQLGCGGYNEATTANACDIDLEYVRLMGLGSGQPGAPGAGTPVDSLFSLTRPYIELAVKNDDSPTQREIVGFKIGSQLSEGYFGIGRYDTTLPGCNPSALEGEGAFKCHRGINRVSGYLFARMQGTAYGCFGLFGCSADPNPQNQDAVAYFDDFVTIYGTRINRAIAQITAVSNPDETLGLTLNVGTNINVHLRFLHGFAIDPSKPQYAADDFFLSFQREQVRYPTFNKSQAFTPVAANPGWWMNVPLAELNGLAAYNIEANGGNLFVNVDLIDGEVGQRPPDNCYGSLTFC